MDWVPRRAAGQPWPHALEELTPPLRASRDLDFYLLCYRSTGKVWQAVSIGKAPSHPDNLVLSGALGYCIWCCRHCRPPCS